MTEFGLIAGHDINISVTVDIARLHIVRRVIGNRMYYPPVPIRILFRQGILIPYDSTHDYIHVAVFIHVSRFTVHRSISAIGNSRHRPVGITVPYKRAFSATNNNVCITISVDVSGNLRPGAFWWGFVND